MEFVNFKISKKLKEKGFTCNYPFAMYNELGDFHPLYTSCEETLVNCMFGNRGYYDYDDFDEADCIAPTISQVLKWLREQHSIHISTKPYPCEDGAMWLYEIRKFNKYISIVAANKTGFIREEESALAGIEYVLDNLINVI